VAQLMHPCFTQWHGESIARQHTTLMDRLWKRLKLSALAGMIAIAAAPTFAAEQELKFPLLKIGTQTLTNATVTTKNKNYIFVLHTGGMTNFKVATLTEEELQTLGFAVATKPQTPTNSVAAWAKGTIGNLQMERVKALEESVKSRFPSAGRLEMPNPRILYAVGAVLLLAYLFFCYCAMLICKKAGAEPGGLIWIPVLQLVPLVRAAGMGPVWILAFIIPVLNLVAQVVWSFKIVKSRGKGVAVAILLLLPVTNLLAFMYLAFSDETRRSHIEPPESRIMTLETV
jgi:hypothetical protein